MQSATNPITYPARACSYILSASEMHFLEKSEVANRVEGRTMANALPFPAGFPPHRRDGLEKTGLLEQIHKIDHKSKKVEAIKTPSKESTCGTKIYLRTFIAWLKVL